jgi:hypothetical protein
MLRNARETDTVLKRVAAKVESRRKVTMANSATRHPIPERAPKSVPANDAVAYDAAANDADHCLWLARSSPLELTLIQIARNERPSQKLRERVLRACGLR